MSKINCGALVGTGAVSAEVGDRILAAARLEGSGVDLDATHPAAEVFGRLAGEVPDFFHKIVLDRIGEGEWARMACALEHAARLCREAASR